MTAFVVTWIVWIVVLLIAVLWADYLAWNRGQESRDELEKRIDALEKRVNEHEQSLLAARAGMIG